MNPGSLALGAALSISALLLAYVENKVLLLKSRIRGWVLVVLVATAGALVYTYLTSLGELSYLVENRYGPVEVAAYGGLLYIGASLPYSSVILFSLVYLIYDTLNSLRREEILQPT
ncbi:MAG: hypothetical protein RMH84_02445 [Sulfolobales archaeon]|nr:hypothetical protein [Sulfolobales archaeon]MCX8209302.1 hypothetical protein [Sulfolobales archaeon]MDW8010437.1 hypothetical protein [Sulfolobales archaeon]